MHASATAGVTLGLMALSAARSVVTRQYPWNPPSDPFVRTVGF